MEQFINDLLRSPSHTVGSEQNHKKPLTKSKTVTIPRGGLRTFAIAGKSMVVLCIISLHPTQWARNCEYHKELFPIQDVSPSHPVGSEPPEGETQSFAKIDVSIPPSGLGTKLRLFKKTEIHRVSIPPSGLGTAAPTHL